jgi:hypothetical protein
MDDYKTRPVLIQGIDILDIVGFVSKKNKKSQAIVLSQLEEILGKDTPQLQKVRKIFLDTMNDYTRSVLTSIFGDIEQSR